jgi:hypothetical protein
MYVFDAAVNDARVVTVPRLDGFRLDVEGAHNAACACSYVLTEAHVKNACRMHMLTQAKVSSGAEGQSNDRG